MPIDYLSLKKDDNHVKNLGFSSKLTEKNCSGHDHDLVIIDAADPV